jgi:hypothetical protein
MKAWFTPPVGIPLLLLIVVVLVHLFRGAV